MGFILRVLYVATEIKPGRLVPLICSLVFFQKLRSNSRIYGPIGFNFVFVSEFLGLINVGNKNVNTVEFL